MTFYLGYIDSICDKKKILELGLKSIGIGFKDKLITSIVESYKYEDITSRHQHEKGGNPRMLKN